MSTIFQPCNETAEVAVLVLPESTISSVAAVLDPLRAANRLAAEPPFSCRVFTTDGAPAELTCGAVIPAHGRLDTLRQADILIVIAGFNQRAHADRQVVSTLRRLAGRVGALGAVDAGSWVLARTGLLDGRQATTHWEDLEDFAAAFPAVQVTQTRFVISGRFFSAGGASPGLDMMLHLIRCRCGPSLATQVASVFIYDEVHAGSDHQPLVSLGRLESMEPRVAEAIRIMEQNIDTPLAIKALADRVGISVRHLETLFARATGSGPTRYYLQLRLQAARRLVIDTGHMLQNIAIRTGFGSQSVFSRAFRRYYGVCPRQMRRASRGVDTPARPGTSPPTGGIRL